ncbi:PREDICTED: LOW QUALITY PROTEIN: NLR family CARD domain-containing protein 4-like [Branchiostoma belcheri]|uniref:LOW QUALITY PROTEIN: NLR family CARD domain-containing protein 4-like n=1 Tax=Branchiostoma belcheri TaxID=7741 RepID=A0A6P5A639_BRABE|nr:PREDICTED: LOW QUALITY PROTEIN: NLR family CARD domain-containing protein 4-like [Branchiostoma belcheri]
MSGLSARARLYQNINDSLNEDDVRSLRAILVTDKHLGQARVENATPQEMFNMLEDDGKIGRGNLGLLADLLKALGKTRLAQEAEDVIKADEGGAVASENTVATTKATSDKNADNEGKGDALLATPGNVDDIIVCLKDLYATEYARVRPLPWCEDFNMDVGEIYTNLQLQRRDGRGHFEDTDTIVSLADIYKTVDVCAKPVVRKIRVEGPPGIAKSCSCRRLAHDWSSGKLHCFKAVFFLEMRHLSGKVKDAIFEQLLPKDIKMTTDQLWSYIEENQKEVLFILDGLDELSQTARESTDVVDLIQGKILRNSHVLVTSRLYHCVEDIEKCHSFYKIVGYSKENSVGFIRKYFSKAPESATKLVEALTNSSNLGEIALNPLNNVLICVVFEENGDNLPSGKAELYQMIIHSIVKRYCTKNGIPIKGRTLPSNIEEALRGLGKLSWEGLQRDQLQFNIDDIRQEFGGSTDDMLNMGLLTRDYSFSRIKRICYCTFLHKTFQEYLAAYYISQLVREESKQDEGVRCLRTLFGVGKTSDVNSPIIKSYEKYREIQNILPVMLGRHADPLFAMFADELMTPGLKGRREIFCHLSVLCHLVELVKMANWRRFSHLVCLRT